MATQSPEPLERVQSLDVLRGLALFGMILVHFHVRSAEVPGFDEIVRTLIWRLVETKSHGTFALLFGAGFALQLRRAEARDAPFVVLYLRRLLVLAVFGFAAHAFFGFNVLLGYAVWGFALLFVRNWSTRALIVTAILSAVSVALFNALSGVYTQASAGPEATLAATRAQRALAQSVHGALTSAESQASYAVLLSARLHHMAWFYTRSFFFMPGVTLALFIVGLLAVRHRIFENPRAHTSGIACMMVFGFVSWLGANWVFPSSLTAALFGLVRDQWLTFTYVGAALLLFAYRPQVLTRLRIVGTAGRMALTNYLAQIAVLDLLFSGYALGLAPIRPVLVPIATIALFAALTAFSVAWLRAFRFGPAEWLWRVLTYGQVVPLRRKSWTAIENAAA
ncbi:MAG TPA: DUF418 domain-containing protein [Gemmatimonadaceae bacterium]|nr:DUF418 domain-containing protein [Gemmatimonadaceae bacterium]